MPVSCHESRQRLTVTQFQPAHTVDVSEANQAAGPLAGRSAPFHSIAWADNKVLLQGKRQVYERTEDWLYAR